MSTSSSSPLTILPDHPSSLIIANGALVDYIGRYLSNNHGWTVETNARLSGTESPQHCLFNQGPFEVRFRGNAVCVWSSRSTQPIQVSSFSDFVSLFFVPPPKPIEVGDYEVTNIDSSGFRVGCTFVPWETFDAIAARRPKKEEEKTEAQPLRRPFNPTHADLPPIPNGWRLLWEDEVDEDNRRSFKPSRYLSEGEWSSMEAEYDAYFYSPTGTLIIPIPHNPASLTDDQIGVADGWRLLYVDEIKTRKETDKIEMRMHGRWQNDVEGSDLDATYRTKLTRAELSLLP